MALPYTRRFVAHYEASSSYVALWTPDDSYHWIIRDIILGNQDATTLHGQVWIQTGSSAFLLCGADVPAHSSQHFPMRQEVLPFEPVRGGFASGLWSVIITGYALSN